MKMFILLPTVLLIIGCAKDDGKSTSVPVPGACSQEIVDSYNDVNQKVSAFNLSRDSQDLRAVNSACSRLSSLMGAGSCKAEIKSSGKIESVSYSNHKTICDEVAKRIEGKTPPTKSPEQPEKKPTPPAASSPKLSSFAKGFNLIVRDVDQVEQFLRQGENAIIQAGRSVNKYSLERGVPFCYLDAKGNDVKLKVGQVLAFPNQQNSAGRVVATSEDMKTSIGCGNWNESYWTVQDLKNVFMGLVDVEGLN